MVIAKGWGLGGKSVVVVHYFFAERFSPTAMQYVCSATFKGHAYRVRFS